MPGALNTQASTQHTVQPHCHQRDMHCAIKFLALFLLSALAQQQMQYCHSGNSGILISTCVPYFLLRLDR